MTGSNASAVQDESIVEIHPTATVGSGVVLSEGVTVGPYCVLDGQIRVGAGTKILPHTVIQGNTVIGKRCRIGPHAALGADPQQYGFGRADTYLVIEDDVIVREFATLHTATKPGVENATRVGRGSLLMVGSHVAHDCRVGESATLANMVQLGGHVTVGDRAVIGGGTVIHQHARVGRLAMVGGGEAMSKDVLPFGAVFRNRHKGYNAVGCRRAGLDTETTRALRRAFVVIHSCRSARLAADRLRRSRTGGTIPVVQELIDFIESSRRGICAGAAGSDAVVAAE